MAVLYAPLLWLKLLIVHFGFHCKKICFPKRLRVWGWMVVSFQRFHVSLMCFYKTAVIMLKHNERRFGSWPICSIRIRREKSNQWSKLDKQASSIYSSRGKSFNSWEICCSLLKLSSFSVVIPFSERKGYSVENTLKKMHNSKSLSSLSNQIRANKNSRLIGRRGREAPLSAQKRLNRRWSRAGNPNLMSELVNNWLIIS